MKRFNLTLGLLGVIFTGAQAQSMDMEAVLIMNEGTNIKPTQFTTPDSIPTRDSIYCIWGVFNNGPDAILQGEVLTYYSSFNRFVNESDPDWMDTVKQFYLNAATAPEDLLPNSFAFGPFSYDSLSKIGLLMDWNQWETNDSVLLLGPPYDEFQPCKEYGMFVRVWGLGDSPASPTNTDDDLSNNRQVVKVIWNCSETGVPVLAAKEKAVLSVYPNPTRERVNFDFDLKENAHVEAIVRDISGRKVIGQNYGHLLAGPRKFGLDIGKLPAGTYTVELSTGELSAIAKFNIQK